MSGMLGIGEVARRTGLRPSALRYYEAQGILPAARRANGRRVYDEGVLRSIEVVVYARSIGFSVREVKMLLPAGRAGHAPRWQSLARAKIAELEAGIERARQVKAALEAGLACGCIRAEACGPTRSERGR